MTTFSTTIVGAATEPENVRSEATAVIFFMKSERFYAIVTPLTGTVRFPFSMRSPFAPSEKSPLTGSIV